MPIALAQEADAASSSVTLGTGTTGGNTVVVAVACLASSPAAGVTGVTLGGSPDNFAPVTPGPLAQDTTSPNDFISVSVWTDPNCAGGATAIQVAGAGVVATWVWEFSGLSATPDLFQVFAVPTYQASWVTALGQTTVPAEAWLAVTCAANQVATETLTPNNVTGWTLQNAYNGTSGTYFWGAQAGYQTVSAIGSPAWSGSFSQASFSVTALVAFGMAPPAAPAAAAVAGAPVAAGVTVSAGTLSTQGGVSSTGPIAQAAAPVGLTPTGVKTGNYTARPGDFVLVNASPNAVTVTLPAAPPNGSLVGVSLVGSAHFLVATPLTVRASGTDVIDAVPASTTSIGFPVTGSTAILQYQTATGTWYTQSTGGQLPGAPAANSPQAADAGFVSWSYDYATLSGTFNGAALPTGGSLYVVQCPVRATTSVTGIRIWLTAAGSGLTATKNAAAVYSSGYANGSFGLITLICSTADQTTNWAGTGVVDAPFTGQPFTVNPPFVWAAFWCTGTTGPSLACTGNQTAAWANGKLAQNPRFGTLSGTFTSLPSSFSVQNIISSAPQYWVGLY